MLVSLITNNTATRHTPLLRANSTPLNFKLGWSTNSGNRGGHENYQKAEGRLLTQKVEATALDRRSLRGNSRRMRQPRPRDLAGLQRSRPCSNVALVSELSEHRGPKARGRP